MMRSARTLGTFIGVVFGHWVLIYALAWVFSVSVERSLGCYVLALVTHDRLTRDGCP